MDFNEFNELINGKKEERNMNIIEMELNKLKEMMETGNIEEFLKDLTEREINKFIETYNDEDREVYNMYKDACKKGIVLVGFFEELEDENKITFIESLTKGYVNELYEKGELNLSYTDKFNIETMFNIVKENGKHGFLEAALYSLINGAV